MQNGLSKSMKLNVNRQTFFTCRSKRRMKVEVLRFLGDTYPLYLNSFALVSHYYRRK